MKVVFMEEVEGTARVGEIKNVADGFARNYLLPRKLAAPATDHYIAIAESRAEKEARRQARLDEEASTYLLPKMEGASVTIEVRVGEQGKLFGSVTARDIAAALQETTGVELEHRQVDLRQPIRELGSHEVTVKLTRNVEVQIVVNVEPLGGMPEVEAEAAEEAPAEAEAEVEEEPAEAEAEVEEAPVEEEPAAEAEAEEEPAEAEEEPAGAEAAVEEAPVEEERAVAEAEVEEEPAEAEAAVEEAPVEEEPAPAEAEVEEEPAEAQAEAEAAAEEAPAEEEREAEGAEDEPSEGEISEDDKGET